MAIDTASTRSSVAIIDDNDNKYTESSDCDNSHSESLFKLIELLFSKHNYNYNKIDSIAVAIGPGSFTGVRAGLSAAQGINLIIQKPLYGVSSLEAQAYGIFCAYHGQKNIRAIIDANRDFVYTQLFNCELIPISGPKIIHKNDLDLSNCITYQDIQMQTIGASHIGLLIRHKLSKTHPISPAKVLYLRNSLI
ncbi:MAG: tRNA (adenosine(37)-N6)-threonylcarbamoyltransferase complex dimerization subunit type 1 TsaB [Wolbachia endosymbiont of Xenopsylla cheopis]